MLAAAPKGVAAQWPQSASRGGERLEAAGSLCGLREPLPAPLMATGDGLGTLGSSVYVTLGSGQKTDKAAVASGRAAGSSFFSWAAAAVALRALPSVSAGLRAAADARQYLSGSCTWKRPAAKGREDTAKRAGRAAAVGVPRCPEPCKGASPPSPGKANSPVTRTQLTPSRACARPGPPWADHRIGLLLSASATLAWFHQGR